jgi:aquaporin Z
MRKSLLAEAIGTFAIVFAGTGAIIVNQASGGTIGHLGIALTFGLIVMTMIASFGDISGAHFNPAVTLGFAAARRFEWQRVPAYLAAQISGAVIASVLLKLMYPENLSLGITQPAGSELQSFIMEVVLSFLLMLLVLSVSTGAKEKGITAAIVIGGMIALEAMFAGPVSGASMNPARSLAPALVSGQWQHLWIYLCAPILGALLAVLACCGVREPGCCRTA